MGVDIDPLDSGVWFANQVSILRWLSLEDDYLRACGYKALSGIGDQQQLRDISGAQCGRSCFMQVTARLLTSSR